MTTIRRFIARARTCLRSFGDLFAFLLWPRPVELPPESGRWDVTKPYDVLRVEQRRVAGEIGKVVRVRGVCGGRPVVAGTRITVEAINRMFFWGWDFKRIAEQLPSLTKEDVEEAVRWAANHPRGKRMKKRKSTKKAKPRNAKGKVKRRRSAVTGRIVSKAFADRHPRTTVAERK